MSRILLPVLLISLSPLAWPITAMAADESPSFLNEVVPIFTRAGCNQGACHGKGAGQNGFRLSLRGYAPEMDYKSLTREFHGRKIDLSAPERSLLLLKAIAEIPHEGGKLFTTDSREYQTLKKWIAHGAPGPNKADPKIVKLSVFPPHQTLKPKETLTLQAIAEFSDGTKQDVTWLTKFESNDPAVVTTTSEGKVTAKRSGETAVRAAFLTEVAISSFTIPFDNDIPAEKYAVGNNFIDTHVFGKLKQLRIEPSDLSSDEEFIRRVFLDTIGTLPTPAEVKAFLADPSPNKRSKWIDSLLERPEYVDYWALQWSDLLQNRKERDHDVRGTKNVRLMHNWIRRQVAMNRPWDELARDVLLAKGNSLENPAVGYYVVTVGEHRHGENSEVVASVAQAFLGTRIGCAQCHNHPLEKYTQDDYYHFASFFSRIKLDRKEPRTGTVLKISHPDPNTNKNPIGVVQPRTGQFLKPQPLDRSVVSIAPHEDPREKLVEWMTHPNNEYFAGAMVNRLWKHYLGVGLVEPVDDLRATNPPTNPELWKALVEEFANKKMDLKHLMKVILNSRTYQLSSATKPTNESETRFYSHYYARRLPAEVLLDAISQATEIPDEFSGYPKGMRAIQIPDPGVKVYFLSLFGKSDRVTACACERNGEVTMPQLLHLQNGDAIVKKIKANEGRLAKLLKEIPDNNQLIDELFLVTHSRKANNRERQAVLELLQAGDPREEVFRDLFWALLNSKNFTFNH